MKKGQNKVLKFLIIIIIMVLAFLSAYVGSKCVIGIQYSKDIDGSTVYEPEIVYDETTNLEETLNSEDSKLAKHEHNYSEISIVEATCEEYGYMRHTCECEAYYDSNYIDPLGHNWINPVIKHRNTSLVLESICSQCGEVREEPFVCNHEKSNIQLKEASCIESGSKSIYCEICEKLLSEEELKPTDHILGEWGVIKEKTCTEDGERVRKCIVCGEILETEVLEASGHRYGPWLIDKVATPIENGIHHKACKCGDVVSEEYELKMAGSDSVYIPGTGINSVFSIGEFSQEYTDTHRVTYVKSYKVFPTAKYDNPIIYGHAKWDLGTLYYTKVGQKIYVSLGGEIHVYEVFVSEYAEYSPNVVAVESGIGLHDEFDFDVLHMYTCHGEHPGAWLVLAKLVE